MDYFKNRLEAVDRSRLLWLLSQLIHELTIHARYYYDQPDAVGRMREANEAIHRVSGHTRDLTNSEEPFTGSRADSIDDVLKLLHPSALNRLCRFAT